MNVMKTSLMIFPYVLGSAFLYIRVCPGLSFATKRIGPPCCTLFTFITCCSLRIILSQNYLLPIISVLAENTLLKTAYHFLLLLVGFDTLTYRKDYDRSPILVGHHIPTAAELARGPGPEDAEHKGERGRKGKHTWAQPSCVTATSAQVWCNTRKQLQAAKISFA